jgi:hypothetical protein
MILEKLWIQIMEEFAKQRNKDMIFETILKPFGMYIFQLSLPYLIVIVLLLLGNAVIVGITLFKITEL